MAGNKYVTPVLDRVLGRFVADMATGKIFADGQTDGFAIANLQPEQCQFIMVGECDLSFYRGVLKKIKEAGYTSLGGSVLFDYTQFTGSIDWEHSHDAHSITPGFEPPPRKVAFVMHDDMALMVAKVLMTRANGSDCQAFLDLAKARAWLGWP